MASLFGAPQAPPPVMAAAPMPASNSASVLEAQKQATAAALARGGRDSTILGKQKSPGAAPVATAASGGGNYSGTSLGSGQ